MKMRGLIQRSVVVLIDLMFLSGVTALQASTRHKEDSGQNREAYIARVEQQASPLPPVTTVGSLWQPSGALAEITTDYKARNVGDTVTLLVAETTTAQSTGDTNSSRTFQTASAITALPGKLKTGGVNPLFGANSATTLKGAGETDAGSNLTTTLAGRVIAVLSNGNMVVEAERQVLINSQRETMLVRGVLRPGDIGPLNTAPSTALADLEIELKGKGVVTDSISRPNPITRAILWLTGF
jgi:flagellar L-ring protein FlgH